MYQVDDSRLYYTELVMDTRPLMGPMGQAYLKSDEYGKMETVSPAWTMCIYHQHCVVVLSWIKGILGFKQCTIAYT